MSEKKSKWDKFVCRKITINDHADISAGRLIFGVIIFLIAEFTTFPVSWIFVLFGLRIHKNQNNKTKEEVKDKDEN